MPEVLIEREVSRALYSHAARLSLPDGALPGVPITWMNTAFKPPSGPFLLMHLMINPPVRLDIARGAYNQIDGLLQITLMVPENGGDPYRLASVIITHFDTDLVLEENGVRVRIVQRPDLGTFIRAAPHWQQPINVHWQVMTNRNMFEE